MTLSALIRKPATGNRASAIPAMTATPAESVARIATVAIANPKGEYTAQRVAGGTESPSVLWWLIRYPERAPVIVAYSPEPTHAEILAWHPEAIAAEPYIPPLRQPSAPMLAREEAAIRAWLARMGETDPALIADVLHRCQQDAEARAFFIGRAVNSGQSGHTSREAP